MLSNPELRQRYDQHGTEGISDVNLADGADFFGALFGSTRFDHLVRRPHHLCRHPLTAMPSPTATPLTHLHTL